MENTKIEQQLVRVQIDIFGGPQKTELICKIDRDFMIDRLSTDIDSDIAKIVGLRVARLLNNWSSCA